LNYYRFEDAEPRCYRDEKRLSLLLHYVSLECGGPVLEIGAFISSSTAQTVTQVTTDPLNFFENHEELFHHFE
jgi:hypothetical protein